MRVGESAVYRTESGRVRGLLYTDEDGREYVAFLGLPYAAPPVGPLRFQGDHNVVQKPQPPVAWRGVRNCRHFGAACPHKEPPGSDHKPRLPHAEDCLHLNIFAPHQPPTDTQRRLPVLVFIHGGGYVFDTAANYGDANICEFVCANGVLAVTLNYRLGLFGFLSTGADGVARGNYGLWDQAAALAWLARNVAAFGGDPDNVTVSGHSAGAASAELLALSPHSRDLFHRLILFGGAANCRWALVSAESTRRKVRRLATLRGFVAPPEGFGSREAESAALVHFLRSLPAEQLKLGLMGLPAFRHDDFQAHLAPCLDGDFLPKAPAQLAKEAPRKPVLAGVTRPDLGIGADPETLQNTALLGIAGQLKNRADHKRAEQIFQQFVPKALKRGSKEFIEGCVNILSDFFINRGLWESGQHWARNGSDVFYFTFDHYKPGMLGPLGKHLAFEGSLHGVELAYVFGQHGYGEFKPDRRDRQFIAKFTAHLAAFARTGNPNTSAKVEFLPISEAQPHNHTWVRQSSYQVAHDFCARRPQKWAAIHERDFFTPKL